MSSLTRLRRAAGKCLGIYPSSIVCVMLRIDSVLSVIEEYAKPSEIQIIAVNAPVSFTENQETLQRAARYPVHLRIARWASNFTFGRAFALVHMIIHETFNEK